MSFLLLNFDQKYKFSNKNNMVSAWRNFKNIFPRPLFIIIFRPEIQKFHPYSILTGDTRVEFVIYPVLMFLPVCMVIEIADKSDMQVTFFSQRVRKCLCELRCLCRPDLAPKKGQNKAFPFPLPLPPGKITFSSVPG